MRRDHINYFIVGLFVLSVSVALLALLYRLTGTTGPTDRYYAYYDNVGGVKYGTVTYYKGYQVGQVERITPEQRDHATRYRVEFSVTRGWQIPRGSAAAIVIPALLAPVVIDIREGPGPERLPPGSELEGAEQANLFAALNGVAADFHELSREGIQPMLRNLNERITALSKEYESLSRDEVRPLLERLQQRLDDPELFADLKQVIDKLDAGADALLSVLREENQQHLASILSNADRGSAQLNEVLVRIEGTRVLMHHLLEQMDQLVAENRSGVTQTVGDAATAMQELRDSIRTVADNVDSILHYLESGTRNINEFSREVRENPGILLRGKPPQDPLPPGGNNSSSVEEEP
ncbi:MAG: MlaD family protein [Chromatiales bacterium]